MPQPCIVHLDLKGAPWKLEVLQELIPFIKANGAAGILLEWEDSFPYTGNLYGIGSLGGCSGDGLYSMDQVQFILKCIQDNGMEAIQLVQTIGHMEFVLKHKQYQQLRELPNSPAVLCPSQPESCLLVRHMVQQVLSAQPNATYIHIGADEAWHMNLCTLCQARSREHEHDKASLFLEHIKCISTFIKKTNPNVTILMWDDMIRSYSVETMKAYNLGNLVEPVVWNYSVQGAFHLDTKMWERYSFVFPRLWVASAYKGANGSSQMICSAQYYASNQMAWRDELAIYSGEIQFGGVILTGWSRYDHYAALCELLPEALPSLVSCLRVWALPEESDASSVVSEELPACPPLAGAVRAAVRAAHALRAHARDYLDGDALTWMNSWQVSHNYTSPLQNQNIANNAARIGIELEAGRAALSAALAAATGRRSAEEYVATYVAPAAARLQHVRAAACARAAAAVPVVPKTDYVE